MAAGVRAELGGFLADYRRTWNVTGPSGRRFLLGGLFYLARTTGFSVAFPLYAKQRGYDPGEIGLFYAAAQFALFVLGIPITFLGGRGLARQVLSIGPIIGAIGVGMILAAPSDARALTLIGAFLAGTGGATFWVLGDPLLAATTPVSERTHVFALKFFIVTLGVSIGGGIGGWVPGALAAIGGTSKLTGLGITLALFAVLDACQTGVFRSIPAYEQPGPLPRVPEPGRSNLISRKVLLVIAAVAAPELGMAVGHNSIRPFLSLFFTDGHGRSESATGTILAVFGLLAGAGALLVPRFSARVGNVAALSSIRIVGATCILLWFAGIGLLPILLLMLFYYFLMDGTEALFIAEAMSRMSVSLRTWLSCVYAMAWSLAASLASLVSGLIQDHDDGHFGKAFAVGAAGYLFSVTWVVFVFPRLPNLSRHDDPVQLPTELREAASTAS